jgi:cytochrome P450
MMSLSSTCLCRCKNHLFPSLGTASVFSDEFSHAKSSFSVAGSITTAAAIRYTLLALISTPAAYASLQKEIDDNVASGRISTQIITDAEAQALPYLQAVICEGLRMWPPTTGLGSKQVPKGGDVICGYRVPEGTQIAHNFSGVMRLKSIWGEDADVFRPERWLEAGAEGEGRLKVMNSVVDLDFGSGKYQCLGKRIALMELNKIFFEVGLNLQLLTFPQSSLAHADDHLSRCCGDTILQLWIRTSLLSQRAEYFGSRATCGCG